uniref:DUF420 domain-containing protein n=2 Tax=Candidatus Bipolaricaulota TaxID=67810 RepID=H5SC83_9BACT|nr:hypothetical protein HGMM_F08F07C28 [uncultured Acetothermia bacterium]BAL59467.1 hypothetical protein HGMM_OP4C103 [Candidatus Acetothermum autotrophicum]
MNAIPVFSIFSAASELVVTALVLYVIISNMRGQVLRWKLLLAVLLFEVLVNVGYMIYRASHMAGETSEALSPLLRGLAGFHGALSLIMLLVLIQLSFLAYWQMQRGRQYFQEHRVISVLFIVVWLVSVLSGELFFALRYLAHY